MEGPDSNSLEEGDESISLAIFCERKSSTGGLSNLAILRTLRILIKGMDTRPEKSSKDPLTALRCDISPHDRAGLREERWYPDLAQFLAKHRATRDRDLNRS